MLAWSSQDAGVAARMLAKLGEVLVVVFLILPILVPIACCYSLPSTPSADRTAVASCSLPTCAASPVLFLLSTQLGAQRCCTGDLPVFSLVSTSCHRRRQNSGSLSLSLTLGCGARVTVLGFMGSGEQRKLGREMEEEMRGLGEEPSKMTVSYTHLTLPTKRIV